MELFIAKLHIHYSYIRMWLYTELIIHCNTGQKAKVPGMHKNKQSLAVDVEK